MKSPRLDFCAEKANTGIVDFTDQHKAQVEAQIVEIVAASLENNVLGQEELPVIATFVLDKIDTIKTQDELAVFLAELSGKYPIFKNIAIVEKGILNHEKENVVVKDMLNLAKNGKIDEAIQLAKTIDK